MIDIHCHILSKLDDGPPGITEVMDMVNAAVETGINHIFATPHHSNGQYENPKEVIISRVNELNQYLFKESIPLIVHPGQELRIHREIFLTLERDEILTLGNGGKYLLLELPSGEIPTYAQDVVYELLLKGITPIIVHPERNRGFIEDHNQLFQLVREGALTQLTAGSIIGHFGKKVKSFSDKIVEHNLVHFIASDAHNTTSRGFMLQQAYETVTKKFGIDRTYYFRENAELLLHGQQILIESPVPIRRFLGVFKF